MIRERARPLFLRLSSSKNTVSTLRLPSGGLNFIKTLKDQERLSNHTGIECALSAVRSFNTVHISGCLLLYVESLNGTRFDPSADDNHAGHAQTTSRKASFAKECGFGGFLVAGRGVGAAKASMNWRQVFVV